MILCGVAFLGAVRAARLLGFIFGAIFLHFFWTNGLGALGHKGGLLCLVIGLLFLFLFLLLSSRSTERKRIFLLIFTFSFLLCLGAYLYKMLQVEGVGALLGFGVTSLAMNFSSASSESNGPSSLPGLESESSSVSVETYRRVLAVDYESDIYEKIRVLEAKGLHNLPPQTRPGEYEEIVRSHLDQAAISVDHLRYAMDSEYSDLRILDQKAVIQEKLFSMLIGEANLARILELSPYSNIREEAFEFLEGEMGVLTDYRYGDERMALARRLDSFIADLEVRGLASTSYRKFYSHFIDEDFRRSLGLPLP